MSDEKSALLPEGEASPTLRQRYPEPFYDPKTNKLLKDPVVAPGGITYERSTWETTCRKEAGQGGEETAPAYENRALKQIIKETLLEDDDLRRSSSRSLLLKAEHSIRKSLTRLASNSVLPTDDPKPISEAYYCPITMSLMKHPVISPAGNSFERDAINRWIDDNQVSPLTRKPLPSKRLLYPNLALQEMLSIETNKMEESKLHPSVRDLKLSLNDETDEEQQEQYTGPTTLQEWEALHQERRQANIQSDLGGWASLLCLLLLVLLFIVLYVMFGWIPAVVGTGEAFWNQFFPGRSCSDVCAEHCNGDADDNDG